MVLNWTVRGVCGVLGVERVTLTIYWVQYKILDINI